MTSLKILVVDDDSHIQTVLKEVISAAGHEVRLLADGRDAEMFALTWKPDLVILDMNMPGKNGWQVAEALKKNPDTKDIHLVALSAHVSQGDVDEAHLAGCELHISKPFDPLAFMSKIEPLFNT